MRHHALWIVLGTVAVLPGCADRAVAVVPPPSAAPSEAQRLQWFREARFGMFIHWGVYAVPAGTYRGQRIGGIGEWIMEHGTIPVAEYRALAQGFTAANYHPEQWAALAKRAGMKYVVITAKHHDGCTLFDTAVSDWSIPKASAARRDVIAPLEKAVRDQGLRLGLYYSQAQDWTNPGGGAYRTAWDRAQTGPQVRALGGLPSAATTDDGKKAYEAAVQQDFDQYLRQVAAPQVSELLHQFHPDLLWWDTPVRMTPERAKLFTEVLAPYPSLVTNNRLGGGAKGDCETPEQHIPPRGFPGRDFEVCMTMNDTWGYKSYDDHWKSTRQILEHLSDISSKGGNFLLNVGPTAAGEIPPASIERLEAVGRWMAVNGEAIWATQASPFAKRLPWGRVTRKADAAGGGETLYLHVWDWPKDGRLVVPHGGQPGTMGRLLAGGAAVDTVDEGGRLVVALPKVAPDPMISVVAVHLPHAVIDLDPPLVSPNAEGKVILSILDADSHGSYAGNMPIGGSGAAMFMGPWTDPVWRLEYRFQAPKAQRWLIQADMASAAPTRLRVGQGATAAVVQLPATGGADVWSTVTLGTLTLPAGEAVFSLVPEKSAWQPIALRTVTLTPIPE